ncbi:calcium uniporter protein, mitochondrial isoform X2 [Cimex lectularius]|uniref:Calcium uniporter protein n=1 Tax=Cimex lectularius TaxID=79782 RepID=A0A8I6S5M3_CIMLE|nr:calcium uniporter protein, mitochondrial isoform X2 [Cimex lectularius]
MATGCILSRSKIFLVTDINRVVSLTCLTALNLNGVVHEGRSWVRRPVRHYRHFCVRAYHDSIGGNQAVDKENNLIMEYKRGLPQLRVPLPTTKKECLFTLRPIGNTVGDLIDMIKKEDSAVGYCHISTTSDIRIASSNSIQDLIVEDFKLLINETQFHVKAPEKNPNLNDLDKLSEIKIIVNQLYSALNVSEHLIKKEKDMVQCLEELKTQLEPLEKKKQELDAMAKRRTNTLTWFGLGLMSVQFGILARLTWWEYSWDIMEPVTYFVTYGTAMACYAYFVLTKQEYQLPDVKDRQHLIAVHRRANKIGLDLKEYNKLKGHIAQLESDLSRIRDPLNPFVPPSLQPSTYRPMEKSEMENRKATS